MGQAKSNHRLPAPTLVKLIGSLSALGASPRPALLSAITRDLRAQLAPGPGGGGGEMTPSIFRDLARHLASMGATPDAELVEAFLELQV